MTILLNTSPARTIRAVLFDLDGTLVDSVLDIIKAVRAMEREFELEPVRDIDIQHWIGNGAAVLVRRVLARDMHEECDAALLSQALPAFMEHYRNPEDKQTRLYDGARELLEYLKQRGLSLALVTNKPNVVTHPLLETLGIDHLFDEVVAGGDVAEAKPHPMMLEVAAHKLKATVSECVMVGDSRNDVEAARAAGIYMIAVQGGYNHGESIEQAGPDRVIESLEVLLDESGW